MTIRQSAVTTSSGTETTDVDKHLAFTAELNRDLREDELAVLDLDMDTNEAARLARSILDAHVYTDAAVVLELQAEPFT